jgi:hypothetical protein
MTNLKTARQISVVVGEHAKSATEIDLVTPFNAIFETFEQILKIQMDSYDMRLDLAELRLKGGCDG